MCIIILTSLAHVIKPSVMEYLEFTFLKNNFLKCIAISYFLFQACPNLRKYRKPYHYSKCITLVHINIINTSWTNISECRLTI